LTTGRPAAEDAIGPSKVEPAARVIGVVLVILGAVLLIMELYPTAEWPRTIAAVVVALASSTIWAISLYVGTLVMLMTMPILIGLGAALVVWAAARIRQGDPWRWPVLVGVTLMALGVSCLIEPPVGGPFVPIVLLALGALLVSARLRASPARST
jgi:uncharacterized membrane protein HdeD (DUF308 family)